LLSRATCFGTYVTSSGLVLVIIIVSCTQRKFSCKPSGSTAVLYYNGLAFYLLVNIVVILLKLFCVCAALNTQCLSTSHIFLFHCTWCGLA
jgi:hypothetical protein